MESIHQMETFDIAAIIKADSEEELAMMVALWQALEPTSDGCMEPPLVPNSEGYIYVGRRGKFRGEKYHRVIWEIYHGSPVPQGLVIDHICKNRRCSNVFHLEAVPHTINVRRGDATILTSELAVQIRELYATRQYSYKQLAKMFNISFGNVGRIIRGETWAEVGGPILRKPSNAHLRGQRKWTNILTPDQVVEIYRRSWAGESNASLAREFGVVARTIGSIRNGETWTWLTNHQREVLDAI